MERASRDLAIEPATRAGLTPALAAPPLLLAGLTVVAMLRVHNLAWFFLPALSCLLYGLGKDRLAPLARVAPPMALFALFGLYAGASLWWSDFPRYARREYIEDFVVPAIGFGAAVFVGVRIRPGLPQRLFVAGLWGFFLLASLIAARVGGPAWMDRFFDTPGYYSTYCFLLAAATVPFLGRYGRPLFYVALGICLHLTGQRIVWIVFPLIALADFLCHGGRIDRRVGLVLLLAIGAFSYAMLGNLLDKKPVDVFDPGKEASGLVTRFLANERVVRWAGWIELGSRHPVAGTGYGRENALRTLAGGEYRAIDHLFHAHNVLINVFIQLGLVGLLLFVLAHGRLLWRLKDRLREPSAQAAVLLVLLFLVRNLVDDFAFGRILLVLGLLLGGCLAMLTRPMERAE